MKRFLRPVLTAAALAAAAVGIATAVGRSPAVGLYVGGAILFFIAVASQGGMVVGAYGEGVTADAIRGRNATRAAYVFFGVVLIALGVLIETLGS
jgi:hypothetical protein